MSPLILATKLFVPPPRPNLVHRPRLIERLNDGLHRKLTLISAPAGFGKTMLISEWLAGNGPTAAWLSLDEGDNDPTRFLTYLITALQTIDPNMGEGVLGVLNSPQSTITESIVTALLNEITSISDNFILVLDDYHVIDAQSVDNVLTYLVEHSPPQLHLVIATREDPLLPLARLRVRGQLTELRATDLRFSNFEAAAFLNQIMGLNLSAENIATLETRTEGWIAGLQLAAISLQGHKDTPRFIKSFSGSHHFVLDYLVEEVLQQQSESVQAFLLQTAILDHLCGPLCDAILRDDSASSQETLGYLERVNLFIIPLDNERRWYRYHHLFADLLRRRFRQTHQEQIPALHGRASVWYERKELLPDAIYHAIAAEDYERVAALVELAWPAWRSPVQLITWLNWVKALPEEMIRNRPVLSVSYAQALLNAGELEAAEAQLMNTERWLEAMSDNPNYPPPKMVVEDETQFQSLPVSTATARAYHAQAVGDIPGTVKYSQRVLDLLPEGEQYIRGSITMLLGLAQWASGDLEAALQALSNGLVSMDSLVTISSAFVLADIKMALGQLYAAANIFDHALQLAMAHDEP
jgi:LuxR family maltose regulon positive regulatory protein